jgi:lysophospholipase L1-like esterase
MNPSGCTDCAQRVVNFNNALPAWARNKTTTASPITVVDLWTGFSTSTDTYDGVHPNENGNAKIAAAYYQSVYNVV